MPRLELTPKDRLILANQYRILEKLYPDEAKEHAHAREAVECGYELAYEWISQHIYEPMSIEDCREVLDILQMFDRLQGSYEELEDKTGIDPSDLRFLGFDGNNEGEYLGFARYFMRDGRYERLQKSGDLLNSHMPTIDIYRRMLAAWRPVSSKYPLDKTDIQRIVAEQVHPQNRK